MATSKKPTDQQKEQLVQTLKFTPRTYTVRINGYGGEIAMGKKNFIDVENYSYNSAEEGDDEYIAVPEELQPFTQGNWWDCDGIEHNSGAEFGGAWLIIEDENGNEVLETELGHNLEDQGCEVECFCSEEIEDYVTDETAVFVGQNFEKGCFFEGELELTAPFDISKFKFVYSEIAGWKILNCVEYDGEDIDGSNGYSTTGKSSSFSFYYRDKDGDIAEYSTPEYPEHQTGPSYWADDWEKVEFKFNKKNQPKIKGWYECVWKTWGTSYGKLFWDSENWIEFSYGKPETVTGVEQWSGLMWDTSDEANKPAKKPRKKKDAKPLTAKDVYPYPHKLNGAWPNELGLPEVDESWDPAAELDKIRVPVLEGEEMWASEAIDRPWTDVSEKPGVKGTYECKFAVGAWPIGDVRNARWTGRSWKENGKKAPEILSWRERSWYPTDDHPTEVGVYEVRENGDWPFPAYARWDGESWLEQKNDAESAGRSRKKTHHMHEWREVD